MMIRIITIILGIGFVFAGVAGFFSPFMPNGLLFGYFEVNAMHNIFHIVSGVIAIMAVTSYRYSVLFLQIFGVIYALITIAGFVMRGDLSFMMMHVNMADNFLHLVISLIALYFGFFYKGSRQRA